MEKIYEQIAAAFQETDRILIGIGSELRRGRFADANQIIHMADFFAGYLKEKNYFIITSHRDNLFAETAMDSSRIVNPMLLQQEQPASSQDADKELMEDTRRQWDAYNKWLSMTLGQPLLLIELGEDFNQPNLFRWPFERITFINKRSCLYRVHEKYSQLPENIGDRTVGVPENALIFLEGLENYLNNRE